MDTDPDDIPPQPAPPSRKLKLALRARAAARAAVMGSRRGWGWLREQWRQGRSPAMWLLGLATGVVSGYAALAFILAIILGIPLIFAAIFFYTSPVTLVTGGDQGIFKCGAPSSPRSTVNVSRRSVPRRERVSVAVTASLMRRCCAGGFRKWPRGGG